MKKLIAVTALSCMIIVAGADLLMAGALDRQNVMPRTNSVTQSMIRVPGVVGMEQFAAMGAIQQAGLAVSVLPSKKTPKSMKGAESMEGRVISQTPASGGMAMYGTTVTIYVNKPKAADPNAAASSTGSSWGTGSSTPSYSNPGASQAAQAQPYAPQQGAMGAPSQGSTPFQVQQYYYPSAQGAAPQDPSQQPPAQQPVDPTAAQPPQDPSQGMPPQDPSQQQGQPPATPPAQ